MKFLSLLAHLTLVSTGFALPGGWNDWNNALTQGDATDIVSKFITILSHSDVSVANATAQALIADNFFEKSDSINMLAGFPLGSTTTTGKQTYINGVLNAPGLNGAETIKILASGNNIVWQWRFTAIGTKQLPVQGFNLFEISEKKQINGLYVEFNSIAWGIDTGFTTTDRMGKNLPVA
ncbi:uncharacterized protein A1O9_11689 [Exophiala aquamarina CBS 119918]|uniref:NTF2-like domain-containing protein n=1 Tax=Exophiala aquamarina CBS 119918 TaxID=1182545 RepID=A0A072NZI9_9EURO|nr:uncharacterized protein A1O9_11689 [Exophiala aquamarina CBS 119918]KEF52448.1 hypothetical protein A1O9_11689 [Exophiala aquamarina CBS 119918]